MMYDMMVKNLLPMNQGLSQSQDQKSNQYGTQVPRPWLGFEDINHQLKVFKPSTKAPLSHLQQMAPKLDFGDQTQARTVNHMIHEYQSQELGFGCTYDYHDVNSMNQSSKG